MARLNSIILRAAKKQIREARENGELEDVDVCVRSQKEVLDEELHDEVRYNARARNNRANREYDWDAMSEVVSGRDDSKEEFRKSKRQFAKKRLAEELEADVSHVEWFFQPGTLVTIKDTRNSQRLWSFDRLGIKPGDTGVVVETEHTRGYRGKQSGSIVNVLGPNGLQEWSATWVFIEDDD